MLPLFKSVPIAAEIFAAGAVPARASQYAFDTVTLGWEARLKTRGRRRSDAGAEFATVLPRGTVMREGDCLVVDALQLVVRVVERPEPVFVVTPRTAADCMLYGYQIGNSHQPLMIDGGAIVVPEVPGMEQVLAYHGIPFERAVRPFTPVGAPGEHRHGA